MAEIQTRKGLDEFSEESEAFERRFEEVFSKEYSDPERTKFIGEVTDWMTTCAAQGQYIPLASAERRAYRSLLQRWSSRLRDQGHYVEGIDNLADFDPNAGFALTGDCPYPGLEPYTQDRRESFFGRELLVSNSVDHLRQEGNRILLIIGASGSGKSSLAMAGVLPKMMEAFDGEWIFAPRLTPGAHPLAELASVIAQAIGQPERAGEIEQRFTTHSEAALEDLATLCEGKPLLLFIDQFEELLTMCRDAEEQALFAQVLCALSEPGAGSDGFCCRTLLTLRTDHLARFENNNALRRLHMRLVGEDNHHYLSAIGFEDIKRAIKGPAAEVGLRFIPAHLIDRLASQTAGLSNGLPLLQFALRRLWQTRPTNEAGEPLDLITEAMVKRLPDVERALGTVADDIYRTFSETQQRVCERLLLELVVLDESFEEPLRRRRNEQELIEVLTQRFHAAADVDAVIHAFVADGLLRRFGEGPERRLEVAHEALLRHWNHIYQLLTGAEVKDRLHLVKQVGREAGDWAGHARSKDYLNLRGERLALAIEYSDGGWLAEAEATAYVDACRQEEEEERLKDLQALEEKERADRAQKAREVAEFKALRARRDLWRLAVLAVLVLTVSVGGGWYRANKESHARELALASAEELERNPQLSLLLAIEAANTTKDEMLPEVESALRSAIRTSHVKQIVKSYGKARFGAAAYTPDGSALALGDSLGGVSLWNVAGGEQHRAVFAHVDDVAAIVFSDDGKKMATGGADGKVVVWDTQTWQRLQVLSAHVGEVNSLAFSRPAGRLLATAGEDAALRVWDVTSGEMVRDPLYGHAGAVKAVAFGRDARQLVSAGADDRVIVWDGQEGRALYSLKTGSLFDMDLSRDGSLLAVAADSNVEVWDTATRNRRWVLRGHTNTVFSVRFSPDAREVATASYDSTVRVWKLPVEAEGTQNQVVELKRFRTEPTSEPLASLITGLAFSPDGDAVAAAFIGGSATVWSVAAGGELLTLPGHQTPVEAVVFHPDGTKLSAAGGNNEQVLSWAIPDGTGKERLAGVNGTAKAVAFSANGASAYGSGPEVLLFLPGATEPKRLEGHDWMVNDLAFNPDGTRLVSVSHDKTAIVWELPSGKSLGKLAGHDDHVIAVAYSPDGKLIATGGRDGKINLWRNDDLQRERELTGHYLGILDLAFSENGQRLISGSKDRTVRVWDVVGEKEPTVIGAHSDVVNAVALHGNFLATGADDGIRLWDLQTLAPLSVFPTRSDGAQSLGFSPDGRYLAAGSRHGVVRVYAMQGDELLQLANARVQRDWKSEECRWFLDSDTCPRTRFRILEEADRHFGQYEFEEGERLLREAQEGLGRDVAAIEAEVAARLGASMVWMAKSLIEEPEEWTEVFENEDPLDMAYQVLVAAASKLKAEAFAPEERLTNLVAYGLVQRGRERANDGEFDSAREDFETIAGIGWSLPVTPEEAAKQLLAMRVITKVIQAGRPRSREEALDRVRVVEAALQLFPKLHPARRLAADLYMALGEFPNAEEHLQTQAGAKEQSAEPLATLARIAIAKGTDMEEAVKHAKSALARDPGMDEAWYFLGVAEHLRDDQQAAVVAFDRISPQSEWAVDALNNAASIYFEHLKDDNAAYQRFARAVQLAPDRIEVLSNYAEFLLASGRDSQAKEAAARAREHALARAYVKAAMSFALFTAELLSGDESQALAELDAITQHVAASASKAEEVTAAGQSPDSWQYGGIRRSLTSRLETDTAKQRNAALMNVLDFVATNGKEGTLDPMRQLLESAMVEN